MKTIHLKAYAKINLGLDVLRKREDNYHEVRMIMQTINLYDKLTLKKLARDTIELRTNLPFLPTNESNLVYKAIRLLKEEFHIRDGVLAILEKHIPVAAGMAGGSTDCAAALKGMEQLFGLRLSRQQLMERGIRLGADVPYCIMGGTALAEGIGELLTPLPHMPDCHVLVVKPAMHVSTKFVYENLDINGLPSHPDINGILQGIHRKDIHAVAGCLGNVLETVTIREYPVIGQIKALMMEHGALGALMSGSGPTIFGLFDRKDLAERGKRACRSMNNGNRAYVVGVRH